MAAEINPADELSALQRKRATLEKVVRVALAVERLHESLQSVVVLGKPLSSASPQVREVMEQLEDSVRAQPINKLKETLKYLEKLVQGKLEIILEIAEMDDEQLLGLSADEDQVETLLETYSKNSQTAVAIKGLLHSRGVETQPTAFSISGEIIVKKLSEVVAREKTCRSRVELCIINMIDDTQTLLAKPDLAPSLVAVMNQSILKLQDNLDHLQSGKSIDNMPTRLEIVEIEGDEVTSLESGKDSHQHFTPQQSVPALKPRPQPSKHKSTEQGGFFYTLLRWLTTPKGVTWDDIKHGRDKD